MKYIHLIITSALFSLSGLHGQNGMKITGGHLNQVGGSIVFKDAKLTNDGDFTSSDGKVLMIGTAVTTNATLGGSNVTVFDTLKTNKTTNDVQLEQDVQVNGDLIFMAGRLLLNGSDVHLGPDGQLSGESETAHATGLTGGELIKTKALNLPAGDNPGNLGAVFTSGSNLGNVTVERGHVPFTSCSGTGINRYFEITTENTGSGTLRFHYLDVELNGIPEAELQLWKLDNNQWVPIAPLAKDAAQNYVETADVVLDGIFTLGSATTLPLQTDFCKDITVELDIMSQIVISPSMVFDNTSYPSCIPHGHLLSENFFDCDDRGPNEVVLTTVDNQDVVHVCKAIVTVVDNIYPCCPPTNVIYVDANTPDDDDGSDWDNAFATLERGLELAGRCAIATEVWVANGTYYPTTGTDQTASFSLLNGIAIYGGFAGGETSLAERDIANNEAILSGDIGTPGDNADNSYHVVYNKGGAIISTAVLDGFTISDGNASFVAGDDAHGAGMYIESASPTVRNCVFKNNTATDRGAGLYCEDAGPTVDSCTFEDNSAKTGGAVANYTGSTAEFNGCSFIDNSATSVGGAMANNSSDIQVVGSIFEGNSASTTGSGGGVYNISSSPEVFNSVFTANEAEEGAGFFNQAESDPNIVNCTFHVNLPGTDGGVIRNLTNTTPVITNCILWGNTNGTSGSEIVSSLPTPVVTYSIVEGGHAGTGNMDVDPLFFSTTNLRVYSCSPAVDAGNSAANTTPFDLDGNDRIKVAGIDIGAYEIQVPFATVNTWTGNGDGTFWNDAANWSVGIPPDPCHDVVVPTGNNVVVPAGYEALGKTLEVELGAEVDAKPMAEMKIGN